jgi:hypothetical protein
MKPAGNTYETRKQIVRIHSRSFSHVDARLDIDVVRRRMQNKKLEMMSDRRPGYPISVGPNCAWTGSKP